MTERGTYSRGFISNIPADLDSNEAMFIKDTLLKYPNEGVYVYSFKENRMLYADGWPEVVGIPNEELTMLGVVDFTASKFAPFVEEVNDKALMFLHQRNKNLKEYCFIIKIKIKHRDGTEIPVEARVSVHDCNEDGTLKSIMGRFQVNNSLRFGEVMRFETFGPEKEEFEEALDTSLFKQLVVSDKEIQALKLAADGFAFKQIADKLNISLSAVDKRIRPLYKRFGVTGLPHLVSFAYKNYLLD